MHRINIFIAIAIIFFSVINIGISQSRLDESRRVVIDRITVNGKTIPKPEFDDIVIFPKNEISIDYHLDIKQDEELDPFVFSIEYKFGDQKFVDQISATNISYAPKEESDYYLTIGALAKAWVAKSAKIEFTVNAKEARLRQELNDLKNERSAKDDSNRMKKKKGKSDSTTSIIIGVVVGIGTMALIVLFFMLSNKGKFKKRNSNSAGVFSMDNNSSQLLRNQDIEKIIEENNNLRAEIAALRGQIDAMHSRGEELKKQNKDLSEKVERLSNSQKEIVDLQQQKDDLFAVIIHDIKNPAALIKSLVDLLRSYDLTATEQQDVIEDIFETTTRIVSLSQEVTRILALEGTKLHLNMTMCDVNEVIKLVYRRNQIAADNKQIEMLHELDANVPKTMFDEQKVDEVIENLLSNAIKFSHKGGQVRVKSKVEEDQIVVEIADNGLGLSQEDINNAFQKGTRLTAQPTANEPSSGFGLWIVKKLIEAHGGKVEVKSTLGKGSTFIVQLPIVDS